MTDLTDVNIKDLLAMSDADLRASLEAMLPKPAYPEHLLGLWAKHPEHGDVLIGDDVPVESCVVVIVRDSEKAAGSSRKHVALSSLTFPHQATKPEDVEPGEAWLVNLDNGSDSWDSVVALKEDFNTWHTKSVDEYYIWFDCNVTLVCPLVPATPVPSDTPEPEYPRRLSSLEDYEAAPVGTIVAYPDNNPWVKVSEEGWLVSGSSRSNANSGMANLGEKVVLREGWGSLE